LADLLANSFFGHLDWSTTNETGSSTQQITSSGHKAGRPTTKLFARRPANHKPFVPLRTGKYVWMKAEAPYGNRPFEHGRLAFLFAADHVHVERRRLLSAAVGTACAVSSRHSAPLRALQG